MVKVVPGKLLGKKKSAKKNKSWIWPSALPSSPGKRRRPQCHEKEQEPSAQDTQHRQAQAQGSFQHADSIVVTDKSFLHLLLSLFSSSSCLVWLASAPPPAKSWLLGQASQLPPHCILENLALLSHTLQILFSCNAFWLYSTFFSYLSS